MWLPDFFILGAAKCATSSLHAYLDQTPRLYFSATKELRILDSEVGDAERFEHLYQMAYADAPCDCLLGDASPAYYHWPHIVIPHIERLYPAQRPKFIVLFRNPIDRAWSHYLHVARLGYRWESFSDALKREPIRAAAIEADLARREQREYAWSGYVAEGLYARQLKPWLQTFDRTQFLFLLTENLEHDPSAVVRDALEFLAAPTTAAIDLTLRHNTRFSQIPEQIDTARERLRLLAHRLRHPLHTLGRALAKRQYGPAALANADISPDERRSLAERFANDVRELRSLTGLDLTPWKDFSP